MWSSNMNMRNAIAAFFVAGFMALAGASAGVPAPAPKAIADPSRPADDRKLDADRKPAEILAFAGIKPGEAIGELLPGGGYYTRLLSDIVGQKGRVYALE